MEGRYSSEPTEPERGPGTVDGSPGGSAVRYSVPEAARALGISERAVRKRITAGTLDAVKAGPAWSVFLPGGNPATHEAVPNGPEDRTVVPSTAPGVALGGTDLQPLADVIADLTRENRELAAAAALWQERARTLEGRFLALTAGDDAPVAAQNRPGATEPDQPASDVLMLRWRRWWRRMIDG
jgi:hypothetical protein